MEDISTGCCATIRTMHDARTGRAPHSGHRRSEIWTAYPTKHHLEAVLIGQTAILAAGMLQCSESPLRPKAAIIHTSKSSCPSGLSCSADLGGRTCPRAVRSFAGLLAFEPPRSVISSIQVSALPGYTPLLPRTSYQPVYLFSNSSEQNLSACIVPYCACCAR